MRGLFEPVAMTTLVILSPGFGIQPLEQVTVQGFK
jgi:hypothetical protein